MTTTLPTPEENLESTIKKEGVTTGVILGVVVTVISIASLYLLVSATSLITAGVISVGLNIIVPLVIAVLLIISLRKKIGGYWTFRQALTGIFVSFLVALVISTVVTLAFTKFVEPDIQERTIRNSQNLTIEFLEAQGLPEETIDESIAQFDEQLATATSGGIGQQIKGFFISLIVLFVVALIFAAIFKRERPVFITDADIDPTTPNTY